MAPSPTDLAPEETRSDMTPMIDCVFLMIIFFVCCDFRTFEQKLTSFLPRDTGGSGHTEPRELLSIQVVCEHYGERDRDGRHPSRFVLRDHRVHWQVGPRTFHDRDALQRELERLANDPSLRVPDPDDPSARRLVECVIEPTFGAVNDDAVRTADACRAAGFDRVLWGGGRGALPARSK